MHLVGAVSGLISPRGETSGFQEGRRLLEMLLRCFPVGPSSSSWDFLWMTMSMRGGCPSALSLAVEEVAG